MPYAIKLVPHGATGNQILILPLAFTNLLSDSDIEMETEDISNTYQPVF